MPRKFKGLKLDVDDEIPGGDSEIGEDSAWDEDNTFTKDGLIVSNSGVVLDDGGGILVKREFNDEDLDVIKYLGKGCSGTVDLVKHKRTGELMALKKIRCYDPKLQAQLLKEIKTLLFTDCSQLVQFYGACVKPDRMIVFGLEYMDRGSLESVLKDMKSKRGKTGCIPESVLANATFQILYGLGYLHFEKRLHRDLKPGNILMNSRGEVKLTDFGISKEMGASLAGTYVGSFKYMSPERIRHTKYSQPADIWSLGMLLIECATGSYPGGDMNIIDVISLTTDTKSPSLNPEDGFTPEFCDFIDHCLKVKPDERLDAGLLLGSSWLHIHGATEIDEAVNNVKTWIDRVWPEIKGESKMSERKEYHLGK